MVTTGKAVILSFCLLKHWRMQQGIDVDAMVAIIL